MMRRTGRAGRALAASSPVLVLAAGVLLAASGCGKHETTTHDGPPVAVQTMTLAPATETATVEATGTLRAAREATLAGKVMGNVTEIRKDAGDTVRAGEILVVIDSRDVAGQVAQARGALAQAQAASTLAETNFHRFEQLHERGAASALELDQARYQFDTASGAVEQAEGAVAAATSYETYARVPAPFDGRVVDRMCEVGDLASPGRPLMKVEDAKHLRLYASLEASRGGAATVGTKVDVLVPEAGTGRFAGTVREITPAADPATRSILVKIDVDADPALQAGLFGRALLPSGEHSVLRVPASAVIRRGSITGVFVLTDGHAMLRMVTLDESRTDMPEVLSGLTAGDVILVDPPATLVVGSPLEARS